MSISERQQIVLSALHPLSEGERRQAAQEADRAVLGIIGDRPQREQFKRSGISEYPGWFSLIVAVLLFVLLLAASVVSIFRVYTSAYESYIITINEPGQAVIVGLATFLMAEFAVVISTLAMRILFTSHRMQLVFGAIAVVAAAIAIVGNAQITRPVLEWSLDSAWQILETLSPPLFVMATALVGERLVTDAIKQRHADESLYQAALTDWQAEADTLRDHLAWRTKYRNALRDQLRRVNGRGIGRTDRIAFMQEMDAQDWTWIVQREEAADQWYVEALPNFQTPLTPDEQSQSRPSADPFQRPILPTPANSKNLPE